MRKLLMFLLALALAGCSAHSQLNITSVTETKPLSDKTYPPHAKEVFITKDALPEGTRYEALATIDVGKASYGKVDYVLEEFAKAARNIGADAVVGIKIWFQPGGWGWATPHGTGTAVKLAEGATVDFKSLDGTWK